MLCATKRLVVSVAALAILVMAVVGPMVFAPDPVDAQTVPISHYLFPPNGVLPWYQSSPIPLSDIQAPPAGWPSAGTLASIPTSCASGAIYVATDQPPNRQLFICSAANVWTRLLQLGGSGALMVGSDGSLDINPAVIPQLGTQNEFTARVTLTDGLSLATTNTEPACSTGTRGTLWYEQGSGTAPDNLQVCVFDGMAFGWKSLIGVQ